MVRTTHPLTHSLTYSLTHSLTHSLAHSLLGIFYSDTGVCEGLVVEELCISLENEIFHKPQCTWTPSSTSAYGGTCSLTAPPNDYFFFAVLSIIISLIGVIFSIMYKVLAVCIMANQPDWKRLPLYDFFTCIFYDPYHVELAMDGDSIKSTKAAKKAFYLNKRDKKIGEIEKDIEEVRHSLTYSLTHSLTHSPTYLLTYSLRLIMII